jgi:hypothetical protein
VDDEHINTGVPFGATSGNVVVTNASGSDQKPFTVIPPPIITNLSPDNGPIGTNVTISGVNFTGVNSVKFGPVAATFTFVNDTTVTTTVPVGAGSNVVLTTAGGGPSAPSPFTVVGAPTVTNLNPTSGVPGTAVVITGTAFTGADQPGNGVKFGLVDAITFTVDSDTQITATVPVGAVTGGVVVTTGAGSSAPQTFTVPAPVITNFTPNQGLPASTVALTGQYFTGVNSVTIGGNPVAFTFHNDGSVDFTVPPASGDGTIRLRTPAGTASTGTFSFPAPSISGFSPTQGIVGTSVVITGNHFLQASVVKFGGVAATAYTVDSDTQITATVPNGAPSGPITVTVPGGTATSATGFHVIGSPTISDFNPKTGVVGTSVVITGTNFTGATDVLFNGISATSFTVDSDTQTTAQAPGGSSTGKITVKGAAGDAVSSADFTLAFAPSITSFSPTSGPTGTLVTIVGTHFTGATGVSIGGVAAAGFSIVDDSTITATVAPTALTDLVSVTTGFGTADSSVLSPKNFTVIPLPVITGMSPNTGVHGTTVVITGTGLSGATAVKFGTISAPFTVDSDTQITATAPAGVITAGVTVSTPGGTSAPSTFTVPGPSITSFTPAVGLSGTVVTLTGSGFTDATNAAFNGTAAASFTVLSDTAMTVTAPVGVSAGKITVATLAGSATSATDFTLPVPSITTFSPTSGIANVTDVVITGDNFLQASTVTFGGVAATTFTVDSNTQITARLPVAAATGPVAVTVPGGTATSATSFTVIGAPTITSFAPNSGFIGTTVSITGTTFTGATAVKIGGVDATFTVDSDTAITVIVPNGAASGPITVVGLAGNAVSVDSFTVIGAPTITRFTPSSGAAGTTVTLTGTDFTGATAVTIGAVPVESFAVVDSTTITAVVPSNGISGTIKVTTPGGSATTPTSFSIPPTITSFSPEQGGPGTTITITGSNFTGTTRVTIGGVDVTSFTVNPDGTITAVVGANGVSGDIVVTTGGGNASAPAPFIVDGPPAVTSFTPSGGKPGANVAVTGTHFTGATRVAIGGTDVASFTVVNDTLLTLVAGSGSTGAITVTTPNGTGTSSANFTFEITSATVVSDGTATIQATAGGDTTLPPFKVRNTGTTVQTLTAVNVTMTNPSSFDSGTMTASASAGTVRATAVPQATTVFTFDKPLTLQPGEDASISLRLHARARTAAVGAVAVASVGFMAFGLLGLRLPRRLVSGALSAMLVAGLTLVLAGCGGGGNKNLDGSLTDGTGAPLAGAPAAIPSSTVTITKVVGTDANGLAVVYGGLPAQLGTVQIQ